MSSFSIRPDSAIFLKTAFYARNEISIKEVVRDSIAVNKDHISIFELVSLILANLSGVVALRANLVWKVKRFLTFF